jgi:hypothetical protein
MIRGGINVAECQGYSRFLTLRLHFLYVYESIVRYTGRVNEQGVKLNEGHKSSHEMDVSAHRKTHRVLEELIVLSCRYPRWRPPRPKPWAEHVAFGF